MELLRRRAAQVIARDGYEAVSMAVIANEVGVSVRMLHRYFPSKSDIVCGGREGSAAALERCLADVPASTSVAAGIAVAVAAVFRDDADEGMLRARLALIGREPELQVVRSSIFATWHRLLAEFIGERLALPSDGLACTADAAAVQAALLRAMVWWAEHGDEASPSESVRAAFAALPWITAEPWRSARGTARSWC